MDYSVDEMDYELLQETLREEGGTTANPFTITCARTGKPARATPHSSTYSGCGCSSCTRSARYPHTTGTYFPGYHPADE